MARGLRVPPGARTVLRWTSRVAFVAACLAVAGIVLVLTVLPRLTGGAALTVLTGSMTPEIPVGSVVLIRPVDPMTLQVGDVATYQESPDEDVFITHRVTEVQGTGEETRFVFKGDANRGEDLELVPPQAVRGEVWFHVPFLGSLRDALHGMNLVILLAPPLLALYAVALLVGAVRDRRRDQDDAVETAPPLDRRLLAARFRRVELGAMADDPEQLALRWSGVLAAADTETFTVLLATHPDKVDDVAGMVRVMGPEAMWTSDRLDGAWEPLATPTAHQEEVSDVPG